MTKRKYDPRKKARIKDFGEVFTPSWLVKDMVPDINKPETTVLEPSCGTGSFLVEILERKLANSTTDEDILTSVQSLYGVEIQEDNVDICRRRLVGLVLEHLRKAASEVMSRHIVYGDFLHPETIWFLRDSFCAPLLGLCQ